MGGKNCVSAEITFALYLAYFKENRRNGGNLANRNDTNKNEIIHITFSGTSQELVQACILAKQAWARVNTKGEALS